MSSSSKSFLGILFELPSLGILNRFSDVSHFSYNSPKLNYFLYFNSHDSRRKGEAVEHIRILAVKNSVVAVDLECFLARLV